MKWRWNEAELSECWSLTEDEILFVEGRAGSNRLGAAVTLKFFQREGRLPFSGKDIPADILKHLGEQTGVDWREMVEYDWRSRTARRQRLEVLSWLGFRRFRLSDRTALQTWLQRDVLPTNPSWGDLQE